MKKVQGSTDLPSRGRAEALKRALAPVVGKLSVALVVALVGLFLFSKIAYELREADTRAFDRSVLRFFHQHQAPLLHDLMLALSQMAGTAVVCLLIGVTTFYFWRKGRFWPDGAAMLLAGAGGWGFVELLKHLFHRERFDPSFGSLGYSFPSGHAFFALTIYGMLAYWFTRDASPSRKWLLWTAAAVVILLVGSSRVVLTAHYPTDVAAGFAVAVPWLWGCLALPSAFHRGGRDQEPEDVVGRQQKVADRHGYG